MHIALPVCEPPVSQVAKLHVVPPQVADHANAIAAVPGRPAGGIICHSARQQHLTVKHTYEPQTFTCEVQVQTQAH